MNQLKELAENVSKLTELTHDGISQLLQVTRKLDERVIALEMENVQLKQQVKVLQGAVDVMETELRVKRSDRMGYDMLESRVVFVERQMKDHRHDRSK